MILLLSQFKILLVEFHMESACDYDSYSIFPIGYRTHSHNLGKLYHIGLPGSPGRGSTSTSIWVLGGVKAGEHGQAFQGVLELILRTSLYNRRLKSHWSRLSSHRNQRDICSRTPCWWNPTVSSIVIWIKDPIICYNNRICIRSLVNICIYMYIHHPCRSRSVSTMFPIHHRSLEIIRAHKQSYRYNYCKYFITSWS